MKHTQYERVIVVGGRKKHPCNNKSNKELLQNWAKNCENI